MAKTCLKVSFFAVNITYAVIALAIAGCAVLYTMKLKEITDLRNQDRYQLDINLRFPHLLPYIFGAVGVLSLLVTCCGFCGVNNKAALILYSIFAFLVFLLAIASAAVLILVAIDQSGHFISETMIDIFEGIKVRPDIKNSLRDFEISLNCCGADGPSNYRDANIRELPDHCKDKSRQGVLSDISNKNGCIKVATKYTEWAFYGMSAGSALVGVLCLISIILSCCLTSRLGSKNIQS